MSSEEYTKHLHDSRWEVVRYINGTKGIEINQFDGLVWPKAIKLLSKDDPIKYKDILRFVTQDFYRIPECQPETLDYIFVTEEVQETIINETSIRCWTSKLKADGYLILHHLVDGDYTFEVFDKNGFKLQLWEKKEKHCALVRYGAFGDMLQTSSILPELKRQGYYVTLFSSVRGAEAIENDSNIDELVVQEIDVVRNQELGKYWTWLQTRFDKFVNLCESVESTWLPNSDKMSFHWPSDVRRKYLNKNYVEFMHELSQVPYELKVKFYPTEDEVQWAKQKYEEFKARSGCSKVIVWSLSGSAVHKVFPYLDEYIARVLLTIPDVTIVLVGGPETFQLQGGWQDEKRVQLTVGDWSMRQTLTFTQKHANLVVGPETGVLNGMCVESMPKIIFLSHSTVENLTRDWRNTHSLHADYKEMKKACDNCCLHRLHRNWDYCTRGPEFGAALCQEKLDRNELWKITERALRTGKVRGQ